MILGASRPMTRKEGDRTSRTADDALGTERSARERGYDVIAEGSLSAAALIVPNERTHPARRTWLERTASLAVADGLALLVAALAARRIAGPAPASLLLTFLVAVTFVRQGLSGMYGSRADRSAPLEQAGTAIGAVSSAAILTLAAAAVVDAPATAVGGIGLAWFLAAVLLAVTRSAIADLRRSARKRGATGKRTLVVGAGVVGLQIARRLRSEPEHGLHPVGFLDDTPIDCPPGVSRSAPVLGRPDEIERIAAETGAEHVLIAFSATRDSDVEPLVQVCLARGLEVSLIPRFFELVNDHGWSEQVGGVPLVRLAPTDPGSWSFAIKHAFDRTSAALALLVLAPLLLVIAAAVRVTSPGPVIFRQRRVGRDGQLFEILKFRTMDIELALRAPDSPPPGYAPGGLEHDPRCTTVGSFLRKTSLDELPQLINVLLGHMSLVGPRPERPEYVARFELDVHRYGRRHKVRSGMTGLSQVRDLRGQTPIAERVQWDNWYVQNWSLGLDLAIIARTPLAVIRAITA